MKPILIFTHSDCEPPGYLRTLLERLGYPGHQVCLEQQEWDDQVLNNISGIVIMGGPGDVNQPSEWMQQEMQVIAQADQLGIPVLGICLGAQLMSKALGGQVEQGQTLEVGWHPVELLPAARSHPWFAGLPQNFTVFQWHAHVFSPPAGAELMATNDCAACQAYSLNQHLALQFHLEMTEDNIRSLIEKYSSDLEGDSDCVQTGEQILQDLSQRCQQAFTIADRLIINWLQSL
jgi:GMP synthase-like glutamine amidotransferase